MYLTTQYQNINVKIDREVKRQIPRLEDFLFLSNWQKWIETLVQTQKIWNF